MYSQLAGRSIKQLIAQKLIKVGRGTTISPGVRIIPQDYTGRSLKVTLGTECIIRANSVIYGGTKIGDNSIIDENVIVGKPELGYAVKRHYFGKGFATIVGSCVAIRPFSTIYSGVSIGNNTSLGHSTVVRSFSKIGANSQIGHMVVIERKSTIGNYVRCSPLSHITSETVIEDRVFLGAGIITINDKQMVWKNKKLKPKLNPPFFKKGSKVGSGTTVASGIVIGEGAMIGSGSMVTRDVKPNTLSYGNPARIKKNHTNEH